MTADIRDPKQTKSIGEHHVCAMLARFDWAPALTRDGLERTDILGLDVHLVCDNYGTHKTPTVRSWLDKHPRPHALHDNLLILDRPGRETLGAEVTRDLLQHANHRSVEALEKDLPCWVIAWNADPKPFIWTETADQILGYLGRLLQRINGARH